MSDTILSTVRNAITFTSHSPWAWVAILAACLGLVLHESTGAEPPPDAQPVLVAPSPGSPASIWTERIVMLAMAISLLGKATTDVFVKGAGSWHDLNSKTDHGKLMLLQAEHEGAVKTYEERISRVTQDCKEQYDSFTSEINDLKNTFTARLKAKSEGIMFLSDQVDKYHSLVEIKDRVIETQNTLISKLAIAVAQVHGIPDGADSDTRPGSPGAGQPTPEPAAPNEVDTL